jgi:hypothetical protein
MDFLTQREISVFKQELKTRNAQQDTEKAEFKKKLKEGLGEEMLECLEHPEDNHKNVKFAQKQQKKKRLARLKENIRKIFSGK